MQEDMHYHGVYVLARAAGIKAEAALIVASASQFVDDLSGTAGAGAHVEITFEDGGSILSRPTAHHVAQTQNLNPRDQRQVWVPFHFLPAAEGENYLQRLVCRKDSATAQEMIARHETYFERPFGLALAGIAAHVYADTFSHYGFSGIRSPYNRIDNSNITLENVEGELLHYLQGKERSFWEKFKSCCENIGAAVGETISGALGHGGAATHPDRPYLRWSFTFEETQARERRNNPETFLEGCEKLHDLFTRLAQARPQDADGQERPFPEIKDKVKAVIETQGRLKDRIAAWKAAARSGDVCESGKIPKYLGGKWNDQLEAFDNTEHSSKALGHPAYLFLQAASMHRNYVLRELLPAHGLVVA